MNDERKDWLDDDSNVTKLLYALSAICAVLLLWDFLPDKIYHRHPHFDQESWFGFYAWFGALSCVVFTVGARFLRLVVQRQEDYYDD